MLASQSERIICGIETSFDAFKAGTRLAAGVVFNRFRFPARIADIIIVPITFILLFAILALHLVSKVIEVQTKPYANSSDSKQENTIRITEHQQVDNKEDLGSKIKTNSSNVVTLDQKLKKDSPPVTQDSVSVSTTLPSGKTERQLTQNAPQSHELGVMSGKNSPPVTDIDTENEGPEETTPLDAPRADLRSTIVSSDSLISEQTSITRNDYSSDAINKNPRSQSNDIDKHY